MTPTVQPRGDIIISRRLGSATPLTQPLQSDRCDHKAMIRAQKCSQVASRFSNNEPHARGRSSRTNPAGRSQARVIDLRDGNTAVEVKDIAGRIDEDQLGAYFDMLERKLSTGMNGNEP